MTLTTVWQDGGTCLYVGGDSGNEWSFVASEFAIDVYTVFTFLVSVLEEDISVVPSATFDGTPMTLAATYRTDHDGLGLHTHSDRPALSVHVFTHPWTTPGVGGTFPIELIVGASPPSIPPDTSYPGQVMILVGAPYAYDDAGFDGTFYQASLGSIVFQHGSGTTVGSAGQSLGRLLPGLNGYYVFTTPQRVAREVYQPVAGDFVWTNLSGPLGPGDSNVAAYSIPNTLWDLPSVGPTSLRYQTSLDSISGADPSIEIQLLDSSWATVTDLYFGAFDHPAMMETNTVVNVGFSSIPQSGFLRVRNFSSDTAEFSNFNFAWSSAGTEVLTDTQSIAFTADPTMLNTYTDVLGFSGEGNDRVVLAPIPRRIHFAVDSGATVTTPVWSNETVIIPAGLGNATTPVAVHIDDLIYQSYTTPPGQGLQFRRQSVCTSVELPTTSNLIVQVFEPNTATWVNTDSPATITAFPDRLVNLNLGLTMAQDTQLRILNNVGGGPYTFDNFTWEFVAYVSGDLQVKLYEQPTTLEDTTEITTMQVPDAIAYGQLVEYDVTIAEPNAFYGFVVQARTFVAGYTIPTVAVTVTVYNDDAVLTDQPGVLDIQWTDPATSDPDYGNTTVGFLSSTTLRGTWGQNFVPGIGYENALNTYQPNTGIGVSLPSGDDVPYGVFTGSFGTIGGGLTPSGRNTNITTDQVVDWLFLAFSVYAVPTIATSTGRSYAQIIG